MIKLNSKTDSVSHGLVRFVRNAFSILASNAMNRAATFVLYALIARYIGANEFGQLSLGLTFFQTFQLLAVAGMRILVTRLVAKNREKSGEYFINGSIAVAFFSILSALILISMASWMEYTDDTYWVIVLLSFGLLPFALSIVCDALFQGHERMQYITYANTIISIGKIIAAYILLRRGVHLITVVWLINIAHLALFAIKWWLVTYYIVKPQFKLNPELCWSMITGTVTFLGIDGLTAVMSSFQILVISALYSEVDVAYFNSAHQTLVPFDLIFQSIIVSVFPIMCRQYELGASNLKAISENLLELMIALVIPIIVGIILLANPLLLLLFGNEDFSSAATILRILSLILLLRVFTQVFGRVLVASFQEKTTLRILLVDTIATVIIGYTLIWQFGVIGAAVATVIVRMIDLGQHYFPVMRSFGAQIDIGKILWKPILASVGMALCLVTVAQGYNIFVSVLIGATIYLAIYVTLMLVTIGGIEQIKMKYLSVGLD